MRLGIVASNYRGLQNAIWTPVGVCALVGPNGTGKTTLLDIPNLLRHAFERDFPSAINHPSRGGAWFLRNMHSKEDKEPSISIGVDDLTWIIILQVEGATVSPFCAERVNTAAGPLASRDGFWSDISLGNIKPTAKKRLRTKTRNAAARFG